MKAQSGVRHRISPGRDPWRPEAAPTATSHCGRQQKTQLEVPQTTTTSNSLATSPSTAAICSFCNEPPASVHPIDADSHFHSVKTPEEGTQSYPFRHLAHTLPICTWNITPSSRRRPHWPSALNRRKRNRYVTPVSPTAWPPLSNCRAGL